MGKLNKNKKMKLCLTSLGLLFLPVVVLLLKVLSDISYFRSRIISFEPYVISLYGGILLAFVGMILLFAILIGSLYPKGTMVVLDQKQKRDFLLRKRMSQCLCAIAFNWAIWRSILINLRVYFSHRTEMFEYLPKEYLITRYFLPRGRVLEVIELIVLLANISAFVLFFVFWVKKGKNRKSEEGGN